MKSLHEVIQAPLISEKGTLLTESANQVLFKVRPDANKIEVKRAVETLFKVKVEQVRISAKCVALAEAWAGVQTGKKPM